MKCRNITNVLFVVDPSLITLEQSELVIRFLEEENIKFSTDSALVDVSTPTLFFIEKRSIKKISHFKNKFIVLPTLDVEDNLGASTINFSSYEEIARFVKKFFLAEKYLLIQERLKTSEKVYDDIKSCLENIDLRKNIDESYLFFESFIELELLLLQEPIAENWNEHFLYFSKKNSEIQSILILKSENLSQEQNIIDDNTFIFKLPLDDFYLYLQFKKFDINKSAEFIDLILSVCLRTLQVLDHKLVKSDGEIDFWKKIFSKIPYPMSIISSLGDLLIYNESFAKIGILPKECLRFKDHDNSEIYQNYYKIRRIDFPINLIQVSYFVFYTSEKDQIQKAGEKASKNSGNIDDLGIISSSIAHELNNPLAGILAALSLLSLEDDWEKEALSDLEDMKNGAKRCKELIEIFLGFSKFSPTANSKISIKDSLDQAMNLLRFRMIESNLRIDMKYSATLEKFSHQVNASIMSMILYLICSELMTAFAHHRLVTLGHLGVLSGEVLEFNNQIVLKLEEPFEYEDKIAQSKLIQHLLTFEKLEINFLKQEIRLIYRS